MWSASVARGVFDELVVRIVRERYVKTPETDVLVKGRVGRWTCVEVRFVIVIVAEDGVDVCVGVKAVLVPSDAPVVSSARATSPSPAAAVGAVWVALAATPPPFLLKANLALGATAALFDLNRSPRSRIVYMSVTRGSAAACRRGGPGPAGAGSGVPACMCVGRKPGSMWLHLGRWC